MNYNKHSNLEGKHAFLSASKYSWTRYTDEHLAQVYANSMAMQKGTELHEYAAKSIELGIKLKSNKQTISMYVNDAIGYNMTPEVCLWYSDFVFGTADSISFNKNLLRIHDLKTGKTKASFRQLYIYAALFCLEYHVQPAHINIELRIYQNDMVEVLSPEPDDIDEIMMTIIKFDKQLKRLKEEA